MYPARVLGPAPELDLVLAPLAGAVPPDLSGHGFLVGPRPRPGDPLLSGDGVVWRLDFAHAGPAGLPLRSRAVRTWDAEEDWADPSRYTTRGLTRMSIRSGIRSLANTAIVPFGDGRLMVTCDVGRPWEIDPVTLEAITPVGAYSEWLWSLLHPVNPLILTTAHPARDPATGAVWFAETQAESHLLDMIRDRDRRDLHITCWDGHGPLQRWRVKGVQIDQSAHQVVLTEDYILIADTAFAVEFRQLFGNRHAAAHLPHGDLHIIRRADLTPDRVGKAVPSVHVRLPINVVHFVAAWRNPGGRLTLGVVALGPNDVSEWIRPGDRRWPDGAPLRPELVGALPSFHDVAPIGRFVIDAERGRILDEALLIDPDRLWAPVFLATPPVGRDRPADRFYFNDAGLIPELLLQRLFDLYRHCPRRVPVDQLLARSRPPQVVCVGADPLALRDAYPLPSDCAVTSPIFVPRRGGAPGGYLSVVVLREESAEIWLFDGDDLARGPLCRLGHPDLTMPLTLHTAWVRAIAPRTAAYRIDREQDARGARRGVPGKALELLKAFLDD